MKNTRLNCKGQCRYIRRIIYIILSSWQSTGPLNKVCPLSGPHDDVIKWKHFPRYWPFVRVLHRSPVNSPRKGQWRGALTSCLICAWINDWANNREAGDLRRNRAHCSLWRHCNVTPWAIRAICNGVLYCTTWQRQYLVYIYLIC